MLRIMAQKMALFSATAILLGIFFNLLLLRIGAEEDAIDKNALRLEAKEMFLHAYRAYMDYAYPHDELMPLSCTGRVRGVTPSRGDVDDSLGNFSLTLVDTLDTLVVMGELDEFERAVKLVVENTRFDSDLVVSVFETNIRMVGGLLSGHILAKLVQSLEESRLLWYSDQLLQMARELADRLLPAFNTTSGVPFSRINLRHGMQSHLREQRDTCTACGGTMLLEFAALSRLTGHTIYEEKARKAMDFLWAQRHRGSNLMGTVLNVHSGDWVLRDAGIGAGIDSYYEYCLKAYILLGEDDYLQRFNKHYEAIMRYVNKGPLFIDVHMHKPTVASRSFMDALLAFWPGLQVLKGDLKSAIEFHETLNLVIQRHGLLPEAFTHDLQVHWGQHPLRPEFIESTYLLYRATKDPHYLRVARNVMNSLNKYGRVKCGFAGVKDIRTMSQEDRMDSFVLSETFKYLYMIFAEPSNMLLDPDNYVLTTEAHFLPLSIADIEDNKDKLPRRILIDPDEILDETSEKRYRSACPIELLSNSPDQMSGYAHFLRLKVQNIIAELTRHSETISSATCPQPKERLRAWAFTSSNTDHVRQLKQMGIEMSVQSDGRLQLTHVPSMALSPEWAKVGLDFMQEMMQIASQLEKQDTGPGRTEGTVEFLNQPHFGQTSFRGSPAQFGPDLNNEAVQAEARLAVPFRGCRPLTNADELRGRIAIMQRQDCLFQEKARFAQQAGAVGAIIVDNIVGTSAENSLPFAMSGDTSVEDDILIPVVFLFQKEGELLIDEIERHPASLVQVSGRCSNPMYIFEQFLASGFYTQVITEQPQQCREDFVNVEEPLVFDTSIPLVLFNFQFGTVNGESDSVLKQKVVEDNIGKMELVYQMEQSIESLNFYNYVRRIGYSQLGMNTALTQVELADLMNSLSKLVKKDVEVPLATGSVSHVVCRPVDMSFTCYRFGS